MKTLRYYQHECQDAVFAHWALAYKRLAFRCATGAGKSLIFAHVIKRKREEAPNERGLYLTFRQELIQQSYSEYIGYDPDGLTNTGIYCAGLGYREKSRNVVFASLDSLWRRPKHLGRFDYMLLDECQIVRPEQHTKFQRLLKALESENEHLQILGGSATTWWEQLGVQYKGLHQFFEKLVYAYDADRAIDDGFLVPPSYYNGSVDVTFENAMDDEVNHRVAFELNDFLKDRKSWLVFTQSIEHAHKFASYLKHKGINAVAISGKTAPERREMILRQFKDGDIRVLCSCDILTTGFNATNCDAIILLRPTKSKGLYVQMMGRGIRTHACVVDYGKTAESRKAIINQSPKKDCILLDYTGSISKLGRFEKIIQPDANGLPSKPGGKIIAETKYVKHVLYSILHDQRKCDHPLFCVNYSTTKGKMITKYLDFEAFGHNKKTAWLWWKEAGGDLPAPKNAIEAIQRKNELNKPRTIFVKGNKLRGARY